MSITLTVFFDNPFWAALVERREQGSLSAAKFVFGAEPSDRQVYEWVLAQFSQLRFSPHVADSASRTIALNPKRRQH